MNHWHDEAMKGTRWNWKICQEFKMELEPHHLHCFLQQSASSLCLFYASSSLLLQFDRIGCSNQTHPNTWCIYLAFASGNDFCHFYVAKVSWVCLFSNSFCISSKSQILCCMNCAYNIAIRGKQRRWFLFSYLYQICTAKNLLILKLFKLLSL